MDRGIGRAGSADPSSQHSHESGFQSATSLNSLEHNKSSHQQILPATTNSLESSSNSSTSSSTGGARPKSSTKTANNISMDHGKEGEEENDVNRTNCRQMFRRQEHYLPAADSLGSLASSRPLANFLSTNDGSVSTKRNSLQSSTLVTTHSGGEEESSIAGSSRRSVALRNGRRTENPSNPSSVFSMKTIQQNYPYDEAIPSHIGKLSFSNIGKHLIFFSFFINSYFPTTILGFKTIIL